ncbi:MAG: esterase-like activity of phytase family protein [Kofleriaceae bacterium]
MPHRLAITAVLIACGKSSEPSKMDRERAAALFTEVVVDTAPGLSGLAVDDRGRLWTVAERDEKAYRITLDAALAPTLETFDIEGVPEGTDLEGMGWLGNGKLALGTEGRRNGVATVVLAEERGTKLVVTSTIQIPDSAVGLHLESNQGAEGVCGFGDTIVVAIESSATAEGKRWAPIVLIEHGAIVSSHRLWLTTKTGKLSALDCSMATDGTITAIAIERHFEVTKFLAFSLPAGTADITPTEALDLGLVLNSTINLEGIAKLPDGRVVAVIDNQWKGITGPSELLVFKLGAVK